MALGRAPERLMVLDAGGRRLASPLRSSGRVSGRRDAAAMLAAPGASRVCSDVPPSKSDRVRVENARCRSVPHRTMARAGHPAHPNQRRYGGQRTFVVQRDDYDPFRRAYPRPERVTGRTALSRIEQPLLDDSPYSLLNCQGSLRSDTAADPLLVHRQRDHGVGSPMSLLARAAPPGDAIERWLCQSAIIS